MLQARRSQQVSKVGILIGGIGYSIRHQIKYSVIQQKKSSASNSKLRTFRNFTSNVRQKDVAKKTKTQSTMLCLFKDFTSIKKRNLGGGSYGCWFWKLQLDLPGQSSLQPSHIHTRTWYHCCFHSMQIRPHYHVFNLTMQAKIKSLRRSGTQTKL